VNTKKLLFYLLAALLGGCIPVMSLHPLFTEETLVFEEKLLGTWVDDPNNPKEIWEFKRVVDESDSTPEFKFNRPDEPKKAYELVFVSKPKPRESDQHFLLSDDKSGAGSFFAHLVKLNNRLFLDVYPNQFPFASVVETLAEAWEKAKQKDPDYAFSPRKIAFQDRTANRVICPIFDGLWADLKY